MFNDDPFYYQELWEARDAEAEANGYDSWADYQQALEDDKANYLNDLRDGN